MTYEQVVLAPLDRVRRALVEERDAWLPPAASWGPPAPAVGEELALLWQIDGVETRVQFQVVSEQGASRVRVHHDAPTNWRPGRTSVTDYWIVALENLRAYCEEDQPIILGTEPATKGDARATLQVTAAREEVFEAITNPTSIEQWLGSRAEVEPQVGGRYAFPDWGEIGPIKILELDEPSRLSYSWQMDDEPQTLVHWELEESGGATRITITHIGFGRDRETEDFYFGWLAYLIKIRAFLASLPVQPTPQPV